MPRSRSGAPLNATVEVGGPEAIPLDELARQVLVARARIRIEIVADSHARYFGAELNDQSLIPGPRARIGSTTFGDWLRQSDHRGLTATNAATGRSP